jgi:ferredoxin
MERLSHKTTHKPALTGGVIDVECLKCGACSKVPEAQAHALRCGRCGAAGDKVRPRFASRLFRDRDGRPLRLRDLYAARQELRLWCSHCRPAHEVRFDGARDVEAVVGAINPTLAEACRYLACPVSHVPGMVAVAPAPRAAAQIPLPFKSSTGASR